MAKYAFDTNLYVDASRQPERMDELRRFLLWALPYTYLSSVVVQELFQGSSSAHQADVVEQQVSRPFERVNRVFAPSVRAWREAGIILARLRDERGGLASSLANDVLLALSCRELGITLVTRDRDLWRIKLQVRDLSLMEPFPQPPSDLRRRGKVAF